MTLGILNWGAHSESATIADDNWQRPYLLWEHANKILETNKGAFHLIDAITTLKRSVDYRIKDLNEKYKLKRISPHLKKKNTIEKLAEFSVIKPLMLSKLIEIRNNIEHNEAAPPEHPLCLELLEFVWYFLRSTDYLCSHISQSLILNFNNDFECPYWLSFRPDIVNNWTLNFNGCIKSEWVSKNELTDFFEVQLFEEKTVELFLSNLPEDESATFIRKYHSNKSLEDLIVNGVVVDDAARMKLITKYFENGYS